MFTLGGYASIITSNVTLNTSGALSLTSSPVINLDWAKGNFSVQIDTSAAVPIYTVYYKQSNDEVTYYQPTDGDMGIITSAMTSATIVSFAPRCAKSIVIYTQNNNTGSTLNISKTTLFFDEK